MSIKNVISNISDVLKKDVYATSDVENLAGGKAFSQSDEAHLRQLMFTGTMGHTFYATQDDMVNQSINFLAKVAKENPQLLAKEIIAGRNDGYIRTAPIMGLILLSATDPTLFKASFNKVILTGNDMEDFIVMTRSFGRGFGSAIKSAINGWLKLKLNEFYAIKYSKQIIRAIRIARPKMSDSLLIAYLMRKSRGDLHVKYLKKHGHEDLYERAINELPKVKAFEDAKLAIIEKDWDKVIQLIEDYDLDPTTLTGKGKLPSKVMVSMSKKMGVMHYIKSLNNLSSEDAFDAEIFKSKVCVESLKKAKVFPFRLYIASRNINQYNTDGIEIKNHLSRVFNDYVRKYDWGKWDKTFAIAPDVSGSMKNQCVYDNNIKRVQLPLAPCVVAGMFAGILYKGLDNSIMIPWEGELRFDLVGDREDSVMTLMDKIIKAPGGSTNMSVPVDYLIKNNKKVDVFIGITDSEEWGRSKWLESWAEYRRKVNNKAKAVLIRVDPYNTNPYDEKLAKEYGIYQVYGWNDSVLSFIESTVL
jgi:hypothetical protein